MTALSSTAPTSRALPARVGFGLLTSILVTLLASSSAPTPLYATYQVRWGFSPVTITVIFGVYALAVLASLLVVGSLSDHVGRRPVLITALGAQAIVMLLFAFAGEVEVLLVARVLQGLATGAAIGAIGAGLVAFIPDVAP
jgi:MFS family permease